VLDLDPIPLAEPDDQPESRASIQNEIPEPMRGRSVHWPSPSWEWFARALIAILCSLHGLAIWWGLGGLAGITNGWPLWRDDHPLYYHSALVTRSFLKSSWTTAGYDPSFMSGYAKSIVFPSSSTLPELAVAAFGGSRPEFAYKIYVLVSAAAVPWLIAVACSLWRIPASGAAIAVVLELLYIWTDFPINYVAFGMLPYFLAIPTALIATGSFVRFLVRGGIITWLISAVLLSLAFLCHLTSAMVVAPAALVAYVGYLLPPLTRERSVPRPRRVRPRAPAALGAERRLTSISHVAIWALPAVVLAANCFWWLPGIWLASTKGESGFVFAHLEGASGRLLQIIAGREPRIEVFLLAFAVPGAILLVHRNRAAGLALLAFCAAGFFWGYLAADFRALDFLQPGRQTYALYSGLALAAGAVLDELFRRLNAASQGEDKFDRWVMSGVVVCVLLMFGFPLYGSIYSRLWSSEDFLSSQPSPRLRWIVDQVRRNLVRGERLLYEEGGFGIPGVPDPFQGGRFSGLLPELTGVEVIGGPYLHASLKANFTQFGEGKLFGKSNWNRDHFVRYANLYRLGAIICWSPHARRFCRANSDLVRVIEDDGTVMIGRIMGFPGDFIEGKGRIEAEAGRIRIRELTPGLDGSVLLRYHSVPYLTTSPSVACEPEYHEEDPVPFIRLRPTAGTSGIDLEIHFPVGR
jgi:hypothetical protein